MSKRASRSTSVVADMREIERRIRIRRQHFAVARRAQRRAPAAPEFQLIAAAYLSFGVPSSYVSTLKRSNSTGGGVNAASCGVDGTRVTSVELKFAGQREVEASDAASVERIVHHDVDAFGLACPRR